MTRASLFCDLAQIEGDRVFLRVAFELQLLEIFRVAAINIFDQRQNVGAFIIKSLGRRPRARVA